MSKATISWESPSEPAQAKDVTAASLTQAPAALNGAGSSPDRPRKPKGSRPSSLTQATTPAAPAPGVGNAKSAALVLPGSDGTAMGLDADTAAMALFLPWGNLTAFRAVSEGLADAIKARCSADNRVDRGGAALDDDIRARMKLIVRSTEKEHRKMLADLYRQRVPEHIREWAAQIPGFATGELFPRLLGLLGHPRIAIPYRWEGKDLVPAGPPYRRSVRQLWQYCGCGDPALVPVKDMTREQKLAMGKRTVIRPLLHTFSTYLVQAHTRSAKVAESQYYQYLMRQKELAQGRRHTRVCINHKRPPMRPDGCGIVAHPEWGAIGSPWRKGHIDMHGHRVTHKQFLKDLWVVSHPDAHSVAEAIALSEEELQEYHRRTGH